MVTPNHLTKDAPERGGLVNKHPIPIDILKKLQDKVNGYLEWRGFSPSVFATETSVIENRIKMSVRKNSLSVYRNPASMTRIGNEDKTNTFEIFESDTGATRIIGQIKLYVYGVDGSDTVHWKVKACNLEWQAEINHNPVFIQDRYKLTRFIDIDKCRPHDPLYREFPDGSQKRMTKGI